jgi:phosphopantothenoylcysteine synthetase/decarboxylase
MLRSSPHVRLKTWDDLLLMSTANADILDPMQAEFGQLVLKSHRIYSTPQKKRKKSDN